MSKLNAAEQKLLDQTKDLPDRSTCNMVTESQGCLGITCHSCPLNHAMVTLGDVRSKVKSTDDGVKQPSHYQLFDGVEAIEVIARSMTQAMFQGYCLGNILKYRLRAGKKSELATLEKDLAKAEFYTELYEKNKALCYNAK